MTGRRKADDLGWTLQHDGVLLTKSQFARRHIKELITSGKVRPGDRLTTREVSEALGISETPCREAIYGLAAEGWLEVQSHVGAVVQGLNKQQIREISALRGLICSLAIELNASRFDDAFLTRLDENIAKSDSALERSDYAAFGQLNYVFHRMLSDGPDSAYCARILENMLGLMSQSRHGIPSYRVRFDAAIEEHREIRNRLRRQDIAGAAALARQHEINTGNFIIAKMTELEEASAKTPLPGDQAPASRRHAAG